MQEIRSAISVLGSCWLLGRSMRGCTNAERVGSGLKSDAYHRAASFISEEQLAQGRTFAFTNGDGRKMTILQTEGELNGVAGIYEYILNPKGQVEHQLINQHFPKVER